MRKSFFKCCFSFNNCMSKPYLFQSCFSDHSKHQFRIELFSIPRRNAFIVELFSDLTAIQTTLFQPKNGVNERFMIGIKIGLG